MHNLFKPPSYYPKSWLISLWGLCLTLSVLSGCSSGPTPTNSAPTTNSPVASPIKIDINSAPIAELDKLELPGTKPSLSERIQGGRPYATAEDLVSKKVISADEYKLIQGLVTVGKSK